MSWWLVPRFFCAVLVGCFGGEKKDHPKVVAIKGLFLKTTLKPGEMIRFDEHV